MTMCVPLEGREGRNGNKSVNSDTNGGKFNGAPNRVETDAVSGTRTATSDDR